MAEIKFFAHDRTDKNSEFWITYEPEMCLSYTRGEWNMDSFLCVTLKNLILIEKKKIFKKKVRTRT